VLRNMQDVLSTTEQVDIMLGLRPALPSLPRAGKAVGMTITSRPLHPNVGGELSGFALGAGRSEAEQKELRALWLEHGFLLIHDPRIRRPIVRSSSGASSATSKRIRSGRLFARERTQRFLYSPTATSGRSTSPITTDARWPGGSFVTAP